MVGRTVSKWLVAFSVLIGSAACGVLTQGNIGYVGPASQSAPTFSWDPVPGAVAYQVIVALDRSLSVPVGTSPLLTTTTITPQQLAWQTGYPTSDRSYFWVMRAYDRNDPRGVLLLTTEPNEVTFPATPGGIQFHYGEPSATPVSSAPSSTPSSTSNPSGALVTAGASDTASPLPSATATLSPTL